MSRQSTVVILLTRSPVAGKVKTRLIPDIGIQKATTVHIELIKKNLALLKRCDFFDKQICLKGDEELFRQHVSTELEVYAQKSDDLGDNMLHAIRTGLQVYSNVILIGSDCPDISVNDLQQADDALNQGYDVVFGPAEDGGYYLIGMNQVYDELFSNINWGESEVFSSTLNKAKLLSLNVKLIRTLYDVDTVKDYARFKCLI